MVKEVNMEKMLADATENFTTGFMCSESVLEVLNRHYELGIGEEAIALSTGFPYGFGDGVRQNSQGRSGIQKVHRPCKRAQRRCCKGVCQQHLP